MLLNEDTLREILHRITRIESRLVQLMLHMGVDPHKKQYDAPKQPTKRDK